ncbi:hypothetical protein Tco_0644561 [Tanacetum coccineum]
MGEADVILGIKIKRENKGIVITQSHYIEKILKKFNHKDCSPVSTPMDPVEKLKPNAGKPVDQLEYSRAIGCLMYAMTSTRHDIAYAVGRLSRYPSVLEGYSDASWINHVEYLSSTSGWVFLLGGCVISWASKKQTCITGSTMESEFVALAAAGGMGNACLVQDVSADLGWTSQRVVRPKDPTEVSKIIRRANETLPDFKERWTEEMGYIQGVTEVMQISAFMSNSKCPKLARRFTDRVPRTVTEMMRRVDDFVKSEEAYMSTELLKGEQPERGPRAPFRGVAPPPSRKENLDKYYDYHDEKGHYTNDCYHLKRQLEAALESGKLNHLVKDVRQRGSNKGRPLRNNNGRGRVINMIREGDMNRKRKSRCNQTEEWMNVLVIFPPISEGDVSDDPLIIEADVEGPLNPNPDGTSWFHQQTADPSRKSGVRGSQVWENPEIREHEEPEDSGEEMVLINSAYLEQKVKIVMVGVPMRIIKHNLNVNMPVTLVAQKRRVLGTKKSQAVMKEVEEWVKAGIVRPVKYLTWISNPMLVKKVDDTWRMCIDFKNLNSACPKDYYLLLEIDLQIEAVSVQMLPGCIQRLSSDLNV